MTRAGWESRSWFEGDGRLVPPPPAAEAPLAAALSPEPLDRLNLLWRHGYRPADPLQERPGFSFKAAAEELSAGDESFPLMARAVAAAVAEEARRDLELLGMLEFLERRGLPWPGAEPAVEQKRERVLRGVERLAEDLGCTRLEAFQALRSLIQASGGPE